MNILIVNGFSNDLKGTTKFDQFKSTILQIFRTQNDYKDTDNKFYIRDKQDIEEFLYEQENSHTRKDSGKQFDQMDMVFLSASPNSRPWSISMRKILSLIKMCIKTQKLLFTGSFGAQALAYLCASNLILNIQIMNNKEDGCKMSDFKQYSNQISKINYDNYFLESSTGDIYTLSHDTNEWIPKFNTGIHNRRDANEYQSIGKYIIKTPTYKPQSQSMNNFLDINETQVKIKKNYYHHWIFQELDSQIVALVENLWDIHSFSFINPFRRFIVLAECDNHGPMIIECKNIIACMFDINSKYKGTIQIVTNFIQNALKVIKQTQNKNIISIGNDRYFQNQSGLLTNIQIAHTNIKKFTSNGNPEEILKNQQKNYQQEQRKISGIRNMQSEETLFHVGQTVKKSRLPDFVSQNFISTKKHKMKPSEYTLPSESLGTQKGMSFQKVTNLIGPPPSILKRRKLTQTTQINFSSPAQDDDDTVQYDQQMVRKLLHPFIDLSCVGVKHLWVPGHITNDIVKHKKTQSQQTLQKILNQQTNQQVKASISQGKLFQSIQSFQAIQKDKFQ